MTAASAAVTDSKNPKKLVSDCPVLCTRLVLKTKYCCNSITKQDAWAGHGDIRTPLLQAWEAGVGGSLGLEASLVCRVPRQPRLLYSETLSQKTATKFFCVFLTETSVVNIGKTTSPRQTDSSG